MIKLLKWCFGLDLSEDDKKLIKALSCDCELNAGLCKIKREVRGRGALFTDIDSLQDCPRWVRAWEEAKKNISDIKQSEDRT